MIAESKLTRSEKFLLAAAALRGAMSGGAARAVLPWMIELVQEHVR